MKLPPESQLLSLVKQTERVGIFCHDDWAMQCSWMRSDTWSEVGDSSHNLEDFLARCLKRLDLTLDLFLVTLDLTWTCAYLLEMTCGKK